MTADGTLFELPGGAVKLAVGVENPDEGFDTRRGDTVPASRFRLRMFLHYCRTPARLPLSPTCSMRRSCGEHVQLLASLTSPVPR